MILPRNEIHVWLASLDQPSTVVQRLAATLSADEQTKANRFHFGLDRDRFVVGRGLLRCILSSYLDNNPDRLRFCNDINGKPGLLNPSYEDGKLCFNLSHSHGLALYGVTRDRRIGTDVEFIRDDLDLELIAQKSFSPNEQAMLRSTPPNNKPRVFFNYWTRKEALLKGLGDGLNGSLNQFDTSTFSNHSGVIFSIQQSSYLTSQWSIQDLSLAQQYAAAVAVEGDSWDVLVNHVLQATGLELNPPCTYRSR